MSLEIYDVSVAAVVHSLTCLRGVLGKAEAFGEEKGVDETVMLGLRLAPDMFGLARQIEVATDVAKGVAARLSGTENPSYADNEKTFAELFARIDKTIAFCKSVERGLFDGAETREVIVMARGNEMKFTGQSYLSVFALPNFYFHMSMAYAILRQAGVPVGKMTFLRGV